MDIEEKNIFYISHIVIDKLPYKSLERVNFYTTIGNKYFFGFSDDPLSEEEWDYQEEVLDIIKLPRLIRIKKDDGRVPWIDPDGKLYLADAKDPYSDKEGMNPLEGIVLK